MSTKLCEWLMLTISSIKTEQIKNLQNASINRSSSMLKLQICTFHLFTQRQVFPRDTIDGISTVKHASWLSLSTSHSSTKKKAKNPNRSIEERESVARRTNESRYTLNYFEKATHTKCYFYTTHIVAWMTSMLGISASQRASCSLVCFRIFSISKL